MRKPPRGTPLNRTYPIARELKACLPFNENTGNKVFDYSGNNVIGTLTNMLESDWQSSERGIALNFDGFNNYIDAGAGAAIVGTGNFAVSAWIKTTTTGREIFVNQRSTSDADGSYQFGVDDSPAGKIEFSVFNSTFGFNFNSNKSINDGKWHHVVVQRINTTDGEIYIDGIFDSSGTGGARSLLSVDVAIGRWNGNGLYLDGLIESVCIWNRSLSKSEIMQLAINPYGMFERSRAPLLFTLPRLKQVLQLRYDLGGRMTQVLQLRNSIFNKMTTVLQLRYSIMVQMKLVAQFRYDIMEAFGIEGEMRYNVSPAKPEWYTSADVLADFYTEGALVKGAISTPVIFHLWNSKGDSNALTMTNCKLTASLSNKLYSGGTDEQGQEVVTEQWLELKSNGTSGGAGITDDAQASFTPVGGDPAVSALSIGDIPPDRARHIHARVNVPVSPTTQFNAFPELLVQYDMV